MKISTIIYGSVEERLWAKVLKTSEVGCWIWTAGSRFRGGYGCINIRENGKRRAKQAHRLAWELTHGPIPPGKHCLHKCDNRLCVNPAHLYIGTQKENVHDAIRRGLFKGFPIVRGEQHGASKLNNEKVRRIRMLYFQGYTLVKLGRLFKMHYSSIADVVNGKTWNHVT